MRRLFGLLVVVALVLAGCGGSGAGSCEKLVDDGISLIQGLVDDISSMTAEELAAGADQFPGATQLQADFDELQRRSDELGCSDEELQRLFASKSGELQSDSPIGRLLIESIKSEPFFSGQ